MSSLTTLSLWLCHQSLLFNNMQISLTRVRGQGSGPRQPTNWGKLDFTVGMKGKLCWSFLLFYIVSYIWVKRFSNKNKCRVGLDFVCEELIGWLWFWSHVSDRLPRPHHQRREEMLQEGGEDILIQDYEEQNNNKSFIINTAIFNKKK